MPKKTAPKFRTLLSGKRLKCTKKPVTWQMGSSCPGKYLVVDCETGDLWVCNPEVGWVLPTAAHIEAVKIALEIYRTSAVCASIGRPD